MKNVEHVGQKTLPGLFGINQPSKELAEAVACAIFAELYDHETDERCDFVLDAYVSSIGISVTFYKKDGFEGGVRPELHVMPWERLKAWADGHIMTLKEGA